MMRNVYFYPEIIEPMQIEHHSYKSNLCSEHNIIPITNKYIGKPMTAELLYKIECELNYALKVYLDNQCADINRWELKVFEEELGGVNYGNIQIRMLDKDIRIHNIRPLDKPVFNNESCSECRENRLKDILM